MVLYWKSLLFPDICWISGSAVWVRDLFPGICGEFADGAILEEASFPWHLWHSAHSVPETPSCGTEYALGAQNSLLWYATRFQGPPMLTAAPSVFLRAKGRK